MNTSGSPRLGEALRALTERLTEAGVHTPRADAELLAAHVLEVSRGRLQTLELTGSVLDIEAAAKLACLGEERAARVPLQHLTGRAPFRHIELSVGPGVFVPRPETEGVAELAITELAGLESPLVVDLCTGSGAIALAIAHEVPAARVWAVEKSIEAHAWAQRNVKEWGADRVTLLQCDITELSPNTDTDSVLCATLSPLAGRLDVLISNPPYVPSGMVPRDPEVRDHDPDLALYSGDDGLDLIRVISRIGLRYVKPDGLLVLEHAEHQGAQIRALLEADGWCAADTHPDLTGRDRATTARRAHSTHD